MLGRFNFMPSRGITCHRDYPRGTRGKGEGKNLATKLTAAAVAKLLPDKKRREIADAGSPGLRLVIQPSGAKSWALRFRRPDGRTGKLTLGPFDPMSELEGDPVLGGPLTLASARRLASDIMRQRALGRDVISDAMSAKRRRKSDHEQRATQGFAPAARRFITEYARPQLRSWDTSARLLGFKPSTLEPYLTDWRSDGATSWSAMSHRMTSMIWSMR
jgi:Arm DNA-binding domain